MAWVYVGFLDRETRKYANFWDFGSQKKKIFYRPDLGVRTGKFRETDYEENISYDPVLYRTG